MVNPRKSWGQLNKTELVHAQSSLCFNPSNEGRVVFGTVFLVRALQGLMTDFSFGVLLAFSFLWRAGSCNSEGDIRFRLRFGFDFVLSCWIFPLFRISSLVSPVTPLHIIVRSIYRFLSSANHVLDSIDP